MQIIVLEKKLYHVDQFCNSYLLLVAIFFPLNSQNHRFFFWQLLFEGNVDAPCDLSEDASDRGSQ